MKRLNTARILMYSHDTFGLGHLRRCRTIAHALVERFGELEVLIISGSSVADAYEAKERVDYVKIPGVKKLPSGDYASIDENTDIRQTLIERETIIQETAAQFSPDIFIVDKEPMGLHSEVEATLKDLRAKGCLTVLGLRDVMDSPRLLNPEWEKKDTIKKISKLYDEIWIYGPADFWNPLKGLNIPLSLTEKVRYVGFLPRENPSPGSPSEIELPDDFILVTTGGGGDGADLMSWVLAAIEHDSSLTVPLVLITGPLMEGDDHKAISRRAATLENVTVIEFASELESILEKARVVIGMCGYNTFCEAISFDKRSLFIPRTTPREEQLVRASRAAELGIAQVLEPQDAAEPAQMAAAMHQLLEFDRPSEAGWDIDMKGLIKVGERVGVLLGQPGSSLAVPVPAHQPDAIKTDLL